VTAEPTVLPSAITPGTALIPAPAGPVDGEVVFFHGFEVPRAYTDVDFTIDADTAELLGDAIPANTRRAYERCWEDFVLWCISGEETRVPLPATGETLANFVSHLIREPSRRTKTMLGPDSIAQHVAAVRSVHATPYPAQPDLGMARKLMRAHRRDLAKKGWGPEQADPLSVEEVLAMAALCDAAVDGNGEPVKVGVSAVTVGGFTIAEGALYKAVLLLGIHRMGRRSELAALDVDDIRIDDKISGTTGMWTNVRWSKTDQSGVGRRVYIPYHRNAKLCGVRAVRAWVAVLAANDILDGPLLRSAGRGGTLENSGRIATTTINNIVKRLAAAAGLDPKRISAHSLRATGATWAFDAGASPADVAEIGGWSPTSPVMLEYWRRSRAKRSHPLQNVGVDPD
jgi:integrase